MTWQALGAGPGTAAAWGVRAGDAVTDPNCATRLSLARGATGAAPCKASEGGGVGGPRADRGSCAPAAGLVAPRPAPAEPRAPQRVPDLDATTYLRSAPRASAGPRRGVPAANATNRAGEGSRHKGEIRA
jgi:hypothetical protein